jgi:hypothetical protein
VEHHKGKPGHNVFSLWVVLGYLLTVDNLKGQLIDEMTKITHGVFRTLEGDNDYCGTVNLYSCSLDKAPDYVRDEGKD